jgi:hypothetical protein
MQPPKAAGPALSAWSGDARCQSLPKRQPALQARRLQCPSSAYRSAAFRSAPWDRVSVAINRLDGQNFSAPTWKRPVFEYPFDFGLRWKFESVEHPPV